MKKWRKVLAAVTAGVICAVGVPLAGLQNALPKMGITASAEEYTYGDLTYDYLEDGTIEITDCDASATEVEIPSEIDGVAVASIGDYAFSDCDSLTSITIPKSITNFGSGAFYNTPWLEDKREENPLVILNHVLVDGLTCVGDIVIPNGVTKIADKAFYAGALGGYMYEDKPQDRAAKITSVIIPDTVVSIGYMAFGGTPITSIVLPESVVEVGDYAFLYSSLQELTVLNPNCATGYVVDLTSLGLELTIYGYDGSEAQHFVENLEKFWNEESRDGKECPTKFVSLSVSDTTTTEPILATGDLDGDGAVTIQDAYAALLDYAKTSAGLNSTLTDVQKKVADVDGDGKITINDAYKILLYYATKSAGGNPSWN